MCLKYLIIAFTSEGLPISLRSLTSQQCLWITCDNHGCPERAHFSTCISICSLSILQVADCFPNLGIHQIWLHTTNCGALWSRQLWTRGCQSEHLLFRPPTKGFCARRRPSASSPVGSFLLQTVYRISEHEKCMSANGDLAPLQWKFPFKFLPVRSFGLFLVEFGKFPRRNYSNPWRRIKSRTRPVLWIGDHPIIRI